jgi:hypothetical protein
MWRNFNVLEHLSAEILNQDFPQRCRISNHFSQNINLSILIVYKLWLLYVPPRLKFRSSTLYLQIAFVCFVWISEQTAIISLYSINWLVL